MKKTAILACALALTTAINAIAEDKTEKLELELPEPYFGGTPLDYFGENLEEPNYKPRPDFMVPAGVTNVSAGKTVTASVADTEFGEFGYLVDGDKSYEQKSLLGLAAGHQWIQIDLGSVHNLYALMLWHFHEGDRVYFDVVVKSADDAEFTKNVQTLFNNDHDNTSEMGAGTDKEYIETYKAKFVDAKGVAGRYIRFYSKGNTSDDFNHYVEAEVFGKPAK